MHAFKTKIMGTFWPLFCFLNAFSKALIGKKQRNMSSSSLAECSAQIAVRDKENRVFYLKLVYELYNDNKPGPHMHEPPSPLGEPESKKIGFSAVRPVFLQVQRSISAKP